MVGKGGVREVLVRFMACKTRVRSRGEGNKVSGCKQEGGADEATIPGQHTLRRNRVDIVQ